MVWIIWDISWKSSNFCNFLYCCVILIKFFLFFIILNSFSCILNDNIVKKSCIPNIIINAKLKKKIFLL